MINHKNIQIIDKNNTEELKIELYNRKRDLVSMRIHGTLKQDKEIIKVAKKLKKECRILTTFLDKISEKIRKEKEKISNINNNSIKKIDKKVK
jgi:hypothetical protein